MSDQSAKLIEDSESSGSSDDKLHIPTLTISNGIKNEKDQSEGSGSDNTQAK